MLDCFDISQPTAQSGARSSFGGPPRRAGASEPACLPAPLLPFDEPAAFAGVHHAGKFQQPLLQLSKSRRKL